jgi:hypothetical protein
MRFEVLQDPTSGLRFIQATGQIGRLTPDVFDLFLSLLHGPVPREIHLHSPGGKLEAGIKLGAAFRAHRLTTVVSRAVPIGAGPEGGPRELFVYQDPECDSSCTYAFIGGVARRFGAEANFGVHRFSTKDATPEDYQMETAVLAQHLFDMGVDPYLLSLASSKSYDDIRWVTVEEAEKMRVIFDDNSKTDFNVFTKDGKPYASFKIRLSNTLFRGTIECGAPNEVRISLLNYEDPPADAAMESYDSAWVSDGRNERFKGHDVTVVRDRTMDDRLQVLRLSISADAVRPESFLQGGLKIDGIFNTGTALRFVPGAGLDREIKIRAENAMTTLPIVLAPCAKQGS